MLNRLLHIRYLLKTLDFQELCLESAALRLLPNALAYEPLVALLDASDHKAALAWVELEISSQSKLAQTDDVAIDGLRTKASMLEVQLSVLINRLSDAQHIVNEYRQRHYRELNEVIGKLLYLKRELLFYQMERDAVFEKDFGKADEEYKRFHESAAPTNIRTVQKLSPTEQKMIQRLFRQASKRCHPDLVRDDQKEVASKWFIDLSKAYMANDLDTVSRICEALENGDILFVPRSGDISERDLLRSAVKRLQTDVEGKSYELMHLEESPLMKTIQSISDWDSYFAGMKATFESECVRLEIELNNIRG